MNHSHIELSLLTKALCVVNNVDAFEILSKINEEENIIEGKVEQETKKPKEFKGFAEGRSK